MKKLKIQTFDIILALLFLGGIIYYLYIKGIIFANFKNLSPKEAFELIQKEKDKVVILDVRTPQEYSIDGHIKGAKLIPLDKITEKISILKKFKNKKIIVYCRSGNRSVSASRILSDLGFKVYNIKGGLNGWKEEGLPVENEN